MSWLEIDGARSVLSREDTEEGFADKGEDGSPGHGILEAKAFQDLPVFSCCKLGEKKNKKRRENARRRGK